MCCGTVAKWASSEMRTTQVFGVRAALRRFHKQGWPCAGFRQYSTRRPIPDGKRQQAACPKAAASRAHSKTGRDSILSDC